MNGLSKSELNLLPKVLCIAINRSSSILHYGKNGHSQVTRPLKVLIIQRGHRTLNPLVEGSIPSGSTGISPSLSISVT